MTCRWFVCKRGRRSASAPVAASRWRIQMQLISSAPTASSELRWIGRLFHAPFDVLFSHFDVVEPDLLYLSNARAAEALTPQHVRGVPELVIEIGSPGTRKRDETVKRRMYERTGVSEYWVVDPEIDTIRVYRREGDGFGRVVERSANAGDILTTSLLPRLEISLSQVLRA